MDRSPLHIAAERGHTNVVELLTEKFHSNVLARTKVSVCGCVYIPLSSSLAYGPERTTTCTHCLVAAHNLELDKTGLEIRSLLP